jgi:hypothetical protein
MPNEVQNFLASFTRKAAADMIKVVEGIPEDKRNWSPLDKGRSAINQAVECAVLAGVTAEILGLGEWPEAQKDPAAYRRASEAIGVDWPVVKAELEKNVDIVAKAIQAVPDEALSKPIDTPFGELTLLQIASYPMWNISYHEGQTTYISTLL